MASASASEQVKLQDAVIAAQKALTTADVAASVDSSKSNVAAVKALSERLATAKAALNNYLFPGSTTKPIPVPPPNNQDSLNPTVITGALAGTLSGENSPVGDLNDVDSTMPAVEDAWNYFVNQIEDVFTGFEGTLEGVEATGFGVETGVAITEVAGGLTAEIGGIEVVGFAVGLLLGEYVIGWILQKVGQYFPNPSIFGFHPLQFLRAGITDLGNQLAGAAEDEAKFVIDILIQPIRVLAGLFGRIINGISFAHNKVARVVQDTVPSAIATAKAYTDTQVVDQQQAVAGAAEQALAQLDPPPTVAQAHAILANAARYGTLVWQFEAVAAAAIISAATYADNTQTQSAAQIAQAKTDAENAAKTAIANLQSSLLTQLSGDEATTSALAQVVNYTLPVEIDGAVAAATAAETSAVNSQISGLQDQITGLKSQIATLTNQSATAQSAIATAQATIDTLQNQSDVDEGAIAEQRAIIASATATIATNATAISDLYTQMTSISDTLAPIQSAQQLQAAQVNVLSNDVDVLLPTAIATIATGLQSLKTQVDECMVDNCDTTNPNNIQNVLKGLLGLLSAAAEIGFIAEAVKDPTGTANALAPLLDSLGATGIDTLNALLSL